MEIVIRHMHFMHFISQSRAHFYHYANHRAFDALLHALTHLPRNFVVIAANITTSPIDMRSLRTSPTPKRKLIGPDDDTNDMVATIRPKYLEREDKHEEKDEERDEEEADEDEEEKDDELCISRGFSGFNQGVREETAQSTMNICKQTV